MWAGDLYHKSQRAFLSYIVQALKKHPFLFKSWCIIWEIWNVTQTPSICSEHKTLCHPYKHQVTTENSPEKTNDQVHFKQNCWEQFLARKNFYFLNCMKKKLYAFFPPTHPILKLLKAKFSIPVFTSTTLRVSCTSLFHSYHTSDICSSQKSDSR